MGIMTRMMRLCKADVHGVMDQLEDKELLLKQYLREMEAGLDIKAQQVRGLTQHLERLADRIAAHGQEAEKLEQDLTLALRKEKEEIARMLIRKRRTLSGATGQMKHQAETLTQEKEQLCQTLAEQRLQYETLKVKADAYGRRVKDGPWDDVGPLGTVEVDDAEIELELLERKEALQKGGTP